MAIALNLATSNFGVPFSAYFRVVTAAITRQRADTPRHTVMIDVMGYAAQPQNEDTKEVDFRRYHAPLADVEAMVGDGILVKAYAWVMAQPDMAGSTGLTTPDDVAVASAEAIQRAIVAATQNRLDAFAQTGNFDSILSACTYATSGVPKFAAQGQYAVTARDATWAALYSLLAQVKAGTKPMPTGYADVEPLLPDLAWPA